MSKKGAKESKCVALVTKGPSSPPLQITSSILGPAVGGFTDATPYRYHAFVVLSILLFATITAHIPFYAVQSWLGIIIAEMIGGMALNIGIVPWNSYLPELARDDTSLEVGLRWERRRCEQR